MVISLSTEEQLARLRRQIPSWMGVVVKAVTERYGDESRQLICDALYQQGQAMGKRAFAEKLRQKPEWNAQDVLDEWQTMFVAAGYSENDIEITEQSPKRVVFRVHRCPLAERWRVLQAPPFMCEIWGCHALGLFRCLNPRFNYTALTSIHRGDEYCQEVWEIE